MKYTQPDQDTCDARNPPCLCETSVDSCETRLVHCDGFARASPADSGRSGPNNQRLRAFHEHHQHPFPVVPLYLSFCIHQLPRCHMMLGQVERFIGLLARTLFWVKIKSQATTLQRRCFHFFTKGSLSSTRGEDEGWSPYSGTRSLFIPVLLLLVF